MSAHEVVMAFEFIYAALSGDAALSGFAPGGIWRSVAPPTVTTTPFVVMGFQAGLDVNTMNAVRIMTDPLLQVKAVGPAANTAAIAKAAAELDEVLKGTSGTANGGLILACYRESPLFLDEPSINGEMWTNIGGLYRLEIQQTA